MLPKIPGHTLHHKPKKNHIPDDIDIQPTGYQPHWPVRGIQAFAHASATPC
jgi:hypothetical protein